MKLRFIPVLAGTVLQIASAAQPKTFNVDCHKGETVTGAVEKADPGDTIKIAGTCRERVIIAKDRLTLSGNPGATLQGGSFNQPSELAGLITLDGAQGTRISA